MKEGITLAAAYTNEQHERLLRALAEQLKLPFMQIARQAELASGRAADATFLNIQHTADMALRVIDGYLLSVELQALPMLELEPVSISAMLQDTAHQLDVYARQKQSRVTIDLAGKYEPVMAHRESLETAFLSLGYSFIEAVEPGESATVLLGSHRTSAGLSAGVYGDVAISADALKRGRVLFGSAPQPIPSFTHSAGAGLFVADSLLQHMNAPLRASKHKSLKGLATTLLPSRQLALV